jgi:hypothetical protein
MRDAGLEVDSVSALAIMNTAFRPDTYSAGAIDLIAAYARGRLEEGTADAWAEDLRALGARGAYFFSVNRFVFCARRSVP